jgi:hypothetical protein|nr:MAG TPA: hypothetical protein [Bacteriophage sp.]
MAYEITLKNSYTTWNSPTPDPPIVQRYIDSAIEVTTLDLNVYTDLLSRKRSWTIQWGYMDKTSYSNLRFIIESQFTNLELPTLSIPDFRVQNVVVKATLNDHSVVDRSGLVENVELTLRETIQASKNYMVS